MNTNGIGGNMFLPQDTSVSGGGTGQVQEQINLFEDEMQNTNEQIGVASTSRSDTFQKSQEILVPLQTSIEELNTQVINLTQQYQTASIFAQTASDNLQTANNVVAAAQDALNNVPEGDEAAKAKAMADYEQALANLKPCEDEHNKAMQILEQIETEMTKTTEELKNLNTQFASEDTKYKTALDTIDGQIAFLQNHLENCSQQVEVLKAQVAAEAAQTQNGAPAANQMQKRTENNVEYDVQTVDNGNGTRQEVFFQNGVKIKARDIDAQGRIIGGTHYDADGKETGHYERGFNEDGTYYDKWYDGDKTYASNVTHRDAAGNTLNEITYHAVTGEVMQPATRTRIENGVEYTIETKANQDGTYTETFYQDGVKIKYRNCDGRGRITEGVHFDENGNVTGRYGRAYHADGSFTDAWFDGNNTEPSVVTQKDAFGNDKNAIAMANAAEILDGAGVEAGQAENKPAAQSSSSVSSNGNNSKSQDIDLDFKEQYLSWKKATASKREVSDKEVKYERTSGGHRIKQ